MLKFQVRCRIVPVEHREERQTNGLGKANRRQQTLSVSEQSARLLSTLSEQSYCVQREEPKVCSTMTGPIAVINSTAS